MNGQAITTKRSVDAVSQNGHPRPASPQPVPLHELSPTGRVAKTVVGVVLFLGWLLLFVMGMSLESVQYSKYVTDAKQHTVNWSNLIIYGFLFTPTNGAILASLAGILGGIASNLSADNRFRQSPPDLSDTRSNDYQSYLYMTENPLVSMLRGFVSYLIFVAGSYLTNFTSTDAANPTQFLGLTASAYFKFAVSVSLLAYLAGYDPSRMKGLIDSFNLTRKEPDPAPPGNFSAHVHEKEITLHAQVPPNPPATTGRRKNG